MSGVRDSIDAMQLVRSDPPEAPVRSWAPEVSRLLDTPSGDRVRRSENAWDPVRVTGGPGTGKTSLITDLAIARLRDGQVDPGSVLVLVSDKRAAARVREQISDGVLGAAARVSATREPLVRTIHSYAFGVLRLQAAAHDNPPPRLITGSEQDVVLRELLAGDADGSGVRWPQHLRPALLTDGFAQELRDLLMRAAERGVGPEQLIALGRKHSRPEWIAAGQEYRQYEQVTLLRGSVGTEAPQASAPAVDAAEMIGAALDAFATDPVLLGNERMRIRHLLVDDAQHLDPQAAQLIRLIGTGTAQTVVAGDPDQSIFGFRGASSTFLEDLVPAGSDRDIVLTENFRSVEPICEITGSITARLPGARIHPVAVSARTGDASADAVTVAVYGSAAKEATAIADAMRRAHLFGGVPWSQMAVIVRSVSRTAVPLRRALRSVGIPVTTASGETPLSRQRSVVALLTALRAAVETLDADEVYTLLTGPIGGADPTALRRLRRGVRRLHADGSGDDRDSLQVIADAIAGSEEPAITALTEIERTQLDRVLRVVAAGRSAAGRHAALEEILWAVWEASGLERLWTGASVRGGVAADQADRDLDSAIALFDAAADYSDNLPAASVIGFIDYVNAMQIGGSAPTVGARSEAVTLCSAHTAAGREWDVVAVAGVLDGLWPSLRSRGGVLRTAELVDLLDGIDASALATISRNAVAVAEERRLLLVACSRARSRLLVTAVDDAGGDAAPSRFIGEIAARQRVSVSGAGTGDSAAGDPSTGDSGSDVPLESLPVDPGVRRVLSLPSLVATLRAELVEAYRGDASDPAVRARAEAATELLARLAADGVAGADPDEWFGLAGSSTDAPLRAPGEDGVMAPVLMSPSSVETLSRCSLRWMLERAGGRDADDSSPAVAGTVVHTLVQALAGQVPPEDVDAALETVWERIDNGAQWYSEHELERTKQMLEHFRAWLTLSRSRFTELGVEVEVRADLPPDDSDDLPVSIVGRIDRLESDEQGRPVVVDVKTGKTVVTKDDAQEHPQLRTYQTAIALGGVDELGAVEPGGGELVYVNSGTDKTGSAVRGQSPMTPEMIDEWIAHIRAIARRTIGPTFAATPNPGCGHCPVTSSCPARPSGKSVTDD
ncbi:ATP-dependent DNA helicase [Gordonia jinhuaensis]|uniref:DNA 3'-5' helicase n=2 Tax=Gordonia jinhuaensis TaxID=1517702 RepID=A0A916WUB6_9ACTN|nr:DNA helicase [Gordonia jinhuaensis]